MSSASDTFALGALNPGASGTLATFEKSLNGHDAGMIDRLREIGFAEGLPVELLHQSPFGRDPIAVRVGGMTVALRRSEANLIKVKLA
jgi:ferrous iron transport protein A